MARYGIIAERRALHGSADEGDVLVVAPRYPGNRLVLEVKAGRQTSNPTRGQIEKWLHQTKVEGRHARCDAMLVVVRFRRSLCNAEVYWESEHGRIHMYLDEFARTYGNEPQILLE